MSQVRLLGFGFFAFVKSLARLGALDLAGGSSLSIFVATVTLNEHLDFIKMKELCFKNRS